MKANELRLGNKIKACADFNDDVNLRDRIFTVVELHEDGLVPDNDFNGMEGEEWSYENFDGIPITEELLLKFWFSKYKDSHIYTIRFPTTDLKKLATFKYRGNEWAIGFADYYTGREKSETLPTLIKYIHQLQNLYFSLTGEELVLTPSSEGSVKGEKL